MFRHSAVALAYYDEDGDRLQRRKAGCVAHFGGNWHPKQVYCCLLLFLHAGAVLGRDD